MKVSGVKVRVYKPCSLYWEAEATVGNTYYFKKFYKKSDAQDLADEMKNSTVKKLEEMALKGQLYKGYC